MRKKLKYILTILVIIIISPLTTKCAGDFLYKKEINIYEKKYDKYKILEMQNNSQKGKAPVEPQRKEFMSNYSWGEGFFGVCVLSLYAACLIMPIWVVIKFRENILLFFSRESPYKFSFSQRMLFVLLALLSAYISFGLWEDESKITLLVSVTIGIGAVISSLTKK